jgi:O-antigen ligase
MRLPLLLVLIIGFFLLSIGSRIAGLYTYWWFSIFRPHEWDWTGTISSLKLPLIAAFLLVVPSAIQGKYPRLNNPIALLFLIWLLLVFLADNVKGCSNQLFIRTNTSFGLFILLYIVLLTNTLITNIKQFYWLIFVISISFAFHSGKGGVIAFYTGTSYYDLKQLGGLFSGSNAYALGSGMLLFFMMFTYKYATSELIFSNKDAWYRKSIFIRLFKILFIILIFGTFYNIIATQSRGSFLSTCIALTLFALFHKNRFKIFTVALFVIGMVFYTVPLPEGYLERVKSAFVGEDELDQSAASRPHFWNTAVIMVKDNPLGVGPGCYPAYYGKYDLSGGEYGIYRSVHSSHFQILADTGYFGFVIWILLFIISYWKLIKIIQLPLSYYENQENRKIYVDLSIMLICSQTVFLLGGSFYEYAYNDIIWLIWSMTIALERILIEKQKDKNIPGYT